MGEKGFDLRHPHLGGVAGETLFLFMEEPTFRTPNFAISTIIFGSLYNFLLLIGATPDKFSP
jgi:hypothetical protein